MASSVLDLVSSLRPPEPNRSQVQVHRLLSVLGAVLVVAFGPLYAVSNPAAVDPLWARLGVASLLFALLGASYRSPHVRKHYVVYLWGILYVLMGWFVVIATLNQFAGDYAVGLLLVYAVLTMVIAFGVKSVQSVLWFLGYGGLLTVGGMMGTPSRTSPLIVLASMGTIALVESILTQGWLWIRETLREQESRLRGLTNSLPGVVFQFYARDDGTVGHYFVSEHAEDVLGLDPDPDTFHERSLECIPTPDREAMERSIQEAIEQETTWEFETPFQRPDGERIWALGASTPERREGEIVFNGVILDITARKEAEQALREERDRFETLFETLPTPVVRCVAEADGTFVTDVNPAFEEVFGLAVPEAVGAEVNQLLVPDEEQPRARAFDRRVLEDGFVQAEVQRTTADGVRDFQVQAALRQPESGPPEIYAVYTDITERKQRERRLDAIFNQTYQFTGLMEPDGTMIEANDTALRFGGLDREDVVGKPLWETHWAQTGEASKQKLRAAIERAAEGEFVRYERPIQGVEEERIIDFSIRPISDEDGTVELLIPEARDITELKRREQKLREAKEAAEEASRLKSALLANMSHEIRTPLTSILGFAEAIEEKTEGLEASVQAADLSALAEFAGLIQHSGQRLMETFTGVLNLSRLEAGEMNLAVEPVDLAAQAEEIAEELRPQAEEKELGLQVQAGEEPTWARADAGGVQIVLRNLVKNAIKYTEEGSVQVRASRVEGETVIEVEDSGIGMDPAQIEALFEPFRQASEGFGREYEGTGLGLAVTKRATEQMGGRIEVETEEGEGTCVTVTLPRAEPASKGGVSSEA